VQDEALLGGEILPIEEIVERSYAQAMADPLPAESTAFEDMLA